MSKPYWNGPDGSHDGSGARRFAGRYATGDDAFEHDASYSRGQTATDTYDDDAVTHRFADSREHDDYDYEDYDYEDYDNYAPDHRWRWVAAAAGAVLLIALIAIAFAMRGGGDTATTSTTPSPQTSVPQDAISTTPRTVVATVPPNGPAAATPLPPETIVTVTTTPADEHPGVPAPPPADAPPPEVAPAQTITYTVTGTRSLFDLVTIIYSDEQGFPRTDINVTLPWTRTVVLNPGVETKSLTATSLTGQLNCTITDGAGAVIREQANNGPVTSC